MSENRAPGHRGRVIIWKSIIQHSSFFFYFFFFQCHIPGAITFYVYIDIAVLGIVVHEYYLHSSYSTKLPAGGALSLSVPFLYSPTILVHFWLKLIEYELKKNILLLLLLLKMKVLSFLFFYWNFFFFIIWLFFLFFCFLIFFIFSYYLIITTT